MFFLTEYSNSNYVAFYSRPGGGHKVCEYKIKKANKHPLLQK